MLLRDDIEKLIPHQGLMCLLERVVSWSSSHIVAATHSHLDKKNPLRGERGLLTLNLCEYGAQAMALHGALVQNAHQQPAKVVPGMLATLRSVSLHSELVDALPEELIVEAVRLHAIDGLVQYNFTVRHGDSLLIEGRATIALQSS